MKPLFEILPTAINAGQSTIYYEVNSQSITILLKDEEHNEFKGIAVYQHNDLQNFGLEDWLEKQSWYLPNNYASVKIIDATNESVLIPFSLFDKNEAASALSLIHGDLNADSEVETDLVNEEGVYNVYRPLSASKQFSDLLADGKMEHLYSSLLRNIPKDTDRVCLLFQPGKFTLVAIRDRKCELINQFIYSCPEDVTYILLKVFQAYQLDEIPVVIYGFIDADSALYKEIRKYFTGVSFAEVGENIKTADEFSQFPAHYFSHYFDLYV